MASIQSVVEPLSEAYYRTVPLELRTFCALTAQVTARALTALGLPSSLQPCQVLYGYPQGNFVVGFTDRVEPGKWNGHVVCTCEGWLIDAATHHLHHLDPQMPDIVAASLLPAWSSALAKKSMDERRSLMWLRPPPGNWQPMPVEPADLVEGYGQALADEVSKRLNV